MTGAVRTKEKCPKCKGLFRGEPLHCPTCGTTPRRYFVYLHWRGKECKIYSGQDNYPLDSWDRAHRLLTAIRYAIDRGTFDPKDFVKKEIKHLQFENYIQTWIARRQAECERQHLARSYFRTIPLAAKNYFIPFFGTKSIRDIRAGDIEDFRNWLPKNLSLKTVRNLLGILHKLFQDAHRWKDILHLPEFPRIQLKEPVTNWIGEEDQEVILANVDDQVYRAAFLFMMKQGCRPNEARALKWEKVDFRNDLVVIDAAFDLNVYRPFTKEKDVRVLPLHPEVKEALSKLPRHLSGFVFVNRHGRPLSHPQINYHWRRAVAQAGVKITCYEGTRHSLASQAINRGVSERIVGDMLGHKTLTSTRRYAKMKADTLKQVWGELKEDSLSKPTHPKGALKGKVINLTNQKRRTESPR